jgi:endonuclease/exonuclease/phosphatase family metal-dependent hydrolase
MSYRVRFVLACFALTVLAPLAGGETIKVATYNIENWHTNFEGHRLQMSTRPSGGPRAALPVNEQLIEIIEQERRQNDEDHFEVSQVILDPAFSPDILVVQEGCRQNDLSFFNKRWLNGAYATTIQFQSNTDRDQHLCMLLKPGFRVLERRDNYHKEMNKERGQTFFARGPAFALVQSPGGYRMWVGVTHQKSKSGNSVGVTQWRNREATRTHAIMKELAAGQVKDVILLGDMNDELGIQEFEAEAGGDAMTNLLGPPADGFVLATKPLIDAGKESFGGYWRTEYRSLIDHIVVTPAMKDQLGDVQVLQTPLASVASDHYPVMIEIRADAAAAPGQ